ncbi:MAG: cytochrome c3 family protein [Planctomycetota bacterium]
MTARPHRSRAPRSVLAISVLLVLVACGRDPAPERNVDPAPRLVGREVCAGCHRAEAEAWRGSDHDRATGPATAPAGVFAGETFEKEGRTTRFSREGAGLMVRTEDIAGPPRDLAISGVIGTRPLAQFLVDGERGARQVLPFCLDLRPGGPSRWYHLHAPESVPPGDALHWQGPTANWNQGCAACHTTALEVGYDWRADRFETRAAEEDVSCEACHGAGSRHAALARAGRLGPRGDRGFEADLLGAPPGTWSVDPVTGNGRRDPTAPVSRQVDACAQCHARRTALVEAALPRGGSLLATHRPALLEAPLYFPHGGIREEVFVWGSFLQSAMHGAGVVCTDCHDPHSGGLRAEGNSLCYACHDVARYDTREHHHHDPAGEGARCVSCHMPERVYMGIDGRRDHAFSVPRPDLARELGLPDACTTCHAGETAAWADEAWRAWAGPLRPRAAARTRAFAADDRGDATAGEALIGVARDEREPPIVRASALARLARHGGGPDDLLREALAAEEPLLRLGGLRALANASPARRRSLAAPRLGDELLALRVEAARLLAAGLAPGSPVAGEERRRLAAAVEEAAAAAALNARDPRHALDLGLLRAESGRPDEAERVYRAMIARDPRSLEARVNLADLLRATGRDPEGLAMLRATVADHPGSAAARHALGLALSRAGDDEGARRELAEAAAAEPETPRYAYVLGVALVAADRAEEGLEVLEAARRRHPDDADLLFALAGYLAERGERDAARRHLERLRRLRPADPEVAALARALGF